MIKWFKEIDSTNSEAQRNLLTASEITFYSAYFQTNGRGQKGNKWESEEGKNLTFSILTKCEFILPVKQFIISKLISLTITDYLLSYGVFAKIKWPNDIYVENKKICGILIENHLDGDILTASIIGVGLNMNQQTFLSDAPNPISLSKIIGKEMNLEIELEKIAEIFESKFTSLKNDFENYSHFLNELYSEKLYRFGEYNQYKNLIKDKLFIGKIVNVNENGTIDISTDAGEILNFSFKEVKFVIDSLDL